MKIPGMKKELTLVDLTFASVGGIIGSGWILASQTATQIAGPAAIISWIIGGIAILLLGLVYTELGAMIPEAGAAVRYPQYSHGSFVSFIMAWAGWLTWVTVAPAEAEAVIQLANAYIPGLYNSSTSLLTPVGLLLSALLILVFFLINYYGVKWFARANTALTWFKFIVPLGTALIFLFGAHHFSNYTSQGFASNGFSNVFLAIGTSGIVFSFLGFRQAIELAGEAKNASRDVPRAVVLSILIGIVVYAGLQAAFVAGVPTADLAKGWGNVSFDNPWVRLAITMNLGWLAMLLKIDGWLSPSGTGLVYTASTGRGLFAMAENRYMWAWLAKLNKSGVPANAMLVNMIVGIITLFPSQGWSHIIGFISVTGVFSYLIGPISAATFRKTAPDLPRPVYLKSMPIVAPIAFIMSGLIVYWSGWNTDKYALFAIIIGLLIYAGFFKVSGFTTKDLVQGTWLVVYIAALLIISYFGDKNFGGTGALSFPMDIVVIAIVSLVCYYWGVASGFETKDLKELKVKLQDESTVA
ncbi:APC family permease [Sulfoacidibacillus thermotolerans]|uniref:Aspartate:proton symporter n=1 Tax=Sulfoacidibacillus thermotolerans TaxID=1765684 RepID=A0A2U3D8J8_SULT2|nr:APC family permease [Sulfoacidibacillus thermotolerans]PWI57608.1 aspartate:proton symporter [Sulfoacidibacillus thermotolerans]